jgi:hypothetical protein
MNKNKRSCKNRFVLVLMNITGGLLLVSISLGVDSTDNAYNAHVVGSTHFSDFPKDNALDAELGSEEDAFVVKIASPLTPQVQLSKK